MGTRRDEYGVCQMGKGATGTDDFREESVQWKGNDGAIGTKGRAQMVVLIQALVCVSR